MKIKLDLPHPPEVLDQLNQEEQRNQVQWALSHLKSSEHLVMNLFYLEELSYEEITVITNLRLANVKVKLHRSKKKLKRLLAPQEFAQRA
ncbi:sigma-70 family RNA polymerase sigma factor [Flavobacteriaceae bacterium]|nr:sigma-70 family RNA polymerase sigma factor [Flavobacteriaceae bacterium]